MAEEKKAAAENPVTDTTGESVTGSPSEESAHEEHKESITKSYPEGYKEKLDEAEKAYSTDDLLRAKEIYLQLTTMHATIDIGWYGLARVYFKENSYAESAKAYSRCLKITPSFGMFQKFFYLSIDNPNRLYEMAQALYREGLNNESLKYTDKLVEMEISPDIRNKVLVLREELTRLIHKEIDESSKDYRKGERTASILTNIFIIIAVLALGALAVFMYSKTPKTNNTAKGKNAFMDAYRLKNDFRMNEQGGPRVIKAFEQSEKILKAAVEKEPDNAEAHFWLARNYQETMEVQKTLVHKTTTEDPENSLSAKIEEHLNRAIELNPDYSEAYLYLGRLKMEQKDPKTAEEFFNLAIKTAKEYYKSEDPETVKQRSVVVETSRQYLRYLKSEKEK